MRNSLLKPAEPKLVVGQMYRRSDMGMYDTFSKNGKVYMHTGNRTRPPSGGGAHVAVNGSTVHDSRTPTLKVVNGKEVIGFQSVLLQGDLTKGEDGSSVSFQDGRVTYRGRAKITV